MENCSVTLRLDNVSTGYRSRGRKITIGNGYTATLPTGKLTCLLGVNGSGKSTLLRSLAKSQNILKGEIFIGERKLTEIPNSEIGKLIGLVLTDRVESPNMTVYDLVSLGRAPYSNFWGNLTNDDKEIVEEAIRSVGIINLRGRKVCSLSDGERQKAMVAKTLAQQTPIILLDEPTAFLDYPSKIELMEMMRRLAHENEKSILLSTHDIPLAMEMADNLWLMDENRNLLIGSPEELNSSSSRIFQTSSGR